MADEADANSLRKQIAFLSNLIKSHKTGPQPSGNHIVKSEINSGTPRVNRSWTRLKKQVVRNKNESRSNNPSPIQPVHQTEKKCGLYTPKTVVSCQHLNSDKLTYRNPMWTSVTLAKNKLDESSKTDKYVPMSGQILAGKTKDACISSRAGSTNMFAVASEVQKHPIHHDVSVCMTKGNSPTKYKLLRNNFTITSNLHSTSRQLPRSRNQAIKSVRKQDLSSKSLRHLTKPHVTGRNKSKQSESNFKWLKKQRTPLKLSINIPKNPSQSLTVPNACKLIWRSKSETKSTGSSLRKNVIADHSDPSKTIPKMSKLMWERRATGNSFALRKTKLSERKQAKTHLFHKTRYTLKRVSANKKSTSRPLSGHLSNRHVWRRKGIVQKGRFEVESKNRSFVERRMKYITHGSHTQYKLYPSKVSNNPCFTYAGQRRVVKIQGMNYRVGSQGKTLQKTDIGKHRKFTMSKVNHYPRLPKTTFSSGISSLVAKKKGVDKIFVRQNSVDKYKNERASQILRRTIQNVRASIKKDNRRKLKSEQYCMFYNRFGKCVKQKQGICPYIHDPTKIAVCTRFLRGTCLQKDGTCPFSHKIDKEKMPICQYFMKGKCTRDDCPYSHVNVGRSAVVCEDFLRGYCALGFKCKKKHVLECEEFNTIGQCPNGSKCKLIHRKKNPSHKRHFKEKTPSGELVPKVKKARHRSSDGFLPLVDSKLGAIGASDRLQEPLISEEAHIKSNVSSRETEQRAMIDKCINLYVIFVVILFSI